MKNVEKKKTLKEKIFKPMDKKMKDLFTKIFVISFVIQAVIFSYVAHWIAGILVTFAVVMSLYFLLCPCKVENNNNNNNKSIRKVVNYGNHKKKK